jgi:threonine aldolase
MGFDFYDWGPGEIRLVMSWDQGVADIENFAAALAGL